SYSWRVRANCGASDGASRWTEGNDFYPCGTFVVSEAHPFFDNFRQYIGSTSCWTPVGNNSAEHPSTWSRRYFTDNPDVIYYAVHDRYGDIYLVSPLFHLPAEDRATLSFTEYIDYATSYTNGGRNSIYVWPEGGDTSSFQLLWQSTSVDNGTRYRACSLDDYKGQTFRLIFKYEGNNAHRWFITDVRVGMDTAYRVTAAVAATADERGTAAVSGEQTSDGRYYAASGVTVTAAAAEHYTFVGWTDRNGELLSTDAEWTFHPTQDTAVYANFDTVSHTLTVLVPSAQAGYGTVTLDGVAPAEGSTRVSVAAKYMTAHTVTAVAAEHYTFSRWSDGVTDNPRTVTMPAADVTLAAVFVPEDIYRELTVSACDSWTLYKSDGFTEVRTFTESYDGLVNYTDVDGAIHLTLHLTIQRSSGVLTELAVCDSYTWVRGDGTVQSYSESVLGEVYSYTDAHGCASTDTLTLTVNRSSESTVEAQTGCDSYRYTYSDGSQSAEIFTESAADAWVVTTNAAGCDSTIHFALT
ncbi:MAG: F5/8 type C domain protein, partial [bacterium F083]